MGSAPNLTITDNIIMKCYRQEPIGNGITIDEPSATKLANELKERYDILAPGTDVGAQTLGGNLQKVILAREITANPRVIVAVQPTRGLDVGAVEAIQQHLLQQRKAGTAILLISEELEELIGTNNRIAVIFDGQVMGVVGTHELNLHEIGLMMTGTRLETLRTPHGRKCKQVSRIAGGLSPPLQS
jgi:simple sugar transport system ATP-binding protein